MSEFKKIAVVSLTAATLGFCGIAYAAEDFSATGDHAALAALYEAKAAEQGHLVMEHERMMSDPDFIRKNPSTSAQMEMAKHCGALISAAKNLKSELEGFAEWHKKQA
ncbi:MAG: hypothetical protein HYT89_01550 [Candidatus Omnitrophica bacterium]|nr:hypothetical protein [Candidatus Omnitrophota bacterium]